MDDPAAILRKAESLEKSARGGFNIFGNRKDKLEDAANEYVRAANGFRKHQNLHQAAQILERAAELQTEIGEPDDAANSRVQASQCYTAKPDMGPDDVQNASRLLKTAINHYADRGNLRRAASYEEKRGEMFDKIGDADAAIEAYEQAGTWHKTEGSVQMANKNFLRVAELAASAGDYPKAIDNFEEVAKASASNHLLKWSLKDYFFKAGICHLCTGDVATTKLALDSYTKIDTSFPTQREFLLLQNVIAAIEAGDEDLFSDHLFQFNQISPLDAWKTQHFLHIKNTMLQGSKAHGSQWSPDAGHNVAPVAPEGITTDDGEIDLS